MPIVGVDLGTPLFWVTCLLAVILVTPATTGAVRRPLLAVVNLGYLFAILGPIPMALVTAALLCCWRLAVSIRESNAPAGLLAVAGLGTTVAFCIDKLPDTLVADWGYGTFGAALGAVGMAYVALRLVELFRAMTHGPGAPPGWADTVNYLVPFHMLAAGPIAGYSDHCKAPAVPEPLTTEDVLAAAERITQGLFKVFVLAEIVQYGVLTGFQSRGLYWFLELQVHYLWLYLDFSGYTDIAVGVGRLLGVHTPENFRRPFAARNLVEFWERWHISLGRWIRRNLFTPIQVALIRRTRGRWAVVWSCVAFGVAFTLCGLWHAFTLRYFLWGCMHAAALMATYVYRAILLRRLGYEGHERYRANRPIRLVAQVVTFEYIAFTMMVALAPSL